MDPAQEALTPAQNCLTQDQKTAITSKRPSTHEAIIKILSRFCKLDKIPDGATRTKNENLVFTNFLKIFLDNLNIFLDNAKLYHKDHNDHKLVLLTQLDIKYMYDTAKDSFWDYLRTKFSKTWMITCALYLDEKWYIILIEHSTPQFQTRNVILTPRFLELMPDHYIEYSFPKTDPKTADLLKRIKIDEHGKIEEVELADDNLPPPSPPPQFAPDLPVAQNLQHALAAGPLSFTPGLPPALPASSFSFTQSLPTAFAASSFPFTQGVPPALAATSVTQQPPQIKRNKYYKTSSYESKYLKYKHKYLQLKQMLSLK